MKLFRSDLFKFLFIIILMLCLGVYVMITILNDRATKSVIIGSNDITVVQSIIDFLKSDDAKEVSNINIKDYETALSAYKKGDYKAALDKLKKIELQKDPIGCILRENCRILISDESYVKIAAVGPLTGDSREKGIKEMLGVALAQYKINSDGGIMGKKLLIALGDDWGNSSQAKKAAEEISDDDNVVAVIGHILSSDSLAAAPVYEKNKLVAVSPTSTTVKLSDAGKYIYRVCPTNEQQGEFLARYAGTKELNAINPVIVYNPKDSYSNELNEFINEDSNDANIHIAGQYIFKQGDVDFKYTIDEIKNIKSNLVFFTGSDTEGAYFVDQLHKLDKNINVLAGDSMFSLKTIQVAGINSNNLYVSSFYHADADRPYQRQFTQEFEGEFRGTPNARCALAYDSVMAVKEAIEKSQKFTREGVSAGMKNVSFEGATGRIKFDENGDVQDKEMLMLKVQNGKFVVVK